jgi:hypothetical protein
MQQQRDARALSGALAVVLVLVSFLALGGDTPDGDASANKVVRFYSAHETREVIAGVVLGLAAVVLIFFCAVVRDRLEHVAQGSSALPNFAFGAGIVASGGFMTAGAIHFALADYANDIQPVAAQALNALDSDFFLPFAIGTVALVLGISLIAIRTGMLASWLGWIGVLLFIVSFTPVGFVGFGLAGIWLIAVSILLYMSAGPAGRLPGDLTHPTHTIEGIAQ